MGIDKPIQTTFIYAYGSKIFKINSTILPVDDKIKDQLEEASEHTNYSYSIEAEVIYEKNLNETTKKSTLFKEGYKKIHTRSELSGEEKTFLRPNMSMLGILKHRSNQSVLSRIVSYGESSNNLSARLFIGLNGDDLAVIKYLDPSIKMIKENGTEQSIFILIIIWILD